MVEETWLKVTWELGALLAYGTNQYAGLGAEHTKLGMFPLFLIGKTARNSSNQIQCHPGGE